MWLDNPEERGGSTWNCTVKQNNNKQTNETKQNKKGDFTEIIIVIGMSMQFIGL